MAHLNEGTLRRMVDDPDARAGADAAHLDSCTECQARFKSVSDDARSIATLLAVAEPQVEVARAFDRVMHAPRSQPTFAFRLPIVRRPARLVLLAAVVAASFVVAAFAASGFFYKPTTVTAVPVSAVDVQTLSQLAQYGTFNWTKKPDLTAATSAVDASNAAGIQEPTVGWVPNGISSTVTYGAITNAQATFTFSAAKASAAAASHGATAPPMPAGLDGATVTLSAGPAVGMVYGDINNQPKTITDPAQINLPQLIVLKSAVPTVKSDTVSLDVLESYLLQQPGLTTELKSAIEAITDPSGTLIVPVPLNYATSTPYTVTGSDAGKGVALGDNTGVGSAVVWISNGYVYVVAGSVKVTDAEKIADNLK